MTDSVSTMIAQKKAVIFDLFDTLIGVGKNDTVPYVSTAEMLGVDPERWNHEIFENSYERLTGKINDPFLIMKGLAHAINPSIPDDEIRKAQIIRMKRFRDALAQAPEETISSLNALRRSGKKLALISNADVTEAEGWQDSPLSKLFDSVIFSCEAGMMKPEKAIYDLCLNELGMEPEDAAFVGDGSCHELEGAKQARLATVMMIGHIKDRRETIEARAGFADFTVESLKELVG
jgi:putative hydrolase of the HAD superfamily